MLPQRVLYYGKDEPLPERVALRAGPLSLFWEEGDLRTVKLGERELLRRVYIAIRDRNWGAVPNIISNLRMKVGDDAFEIAFDVENKEHDLEFRWQGHITGTSDGVVTYQTKANGRTYVSVHPAMVAAE